MYMTSSHAWIDNVSQGIGLIGKCPSIVPIYIGQVLLAKELAVNLKYRFLV